MNKDTSNYLNFSYFEPPIQQKNKKPDDTYTISDAYDHITGGALKPITDKIRAAKTKEEKDTLKRNDAPFVTFSGTFKEKNQQSVISRSIYLALDDDGLTDPEEYRRHWEIISTELNPALMFRSPKGEGIKAVVCVDPDGDTKEYYAAFSNWIETFNIKLDQAPKNVSTACFLCHDPDAVLNNEPVLWDQELLDKWGGKQPVKTPPNTTTAPSSDAATTTGTVDGDPYKIAAGMIQAAEKGEKHTQLIKAARFLGGFVGSGGMQYSDAEKFLQAEIEKRKKDIDSMDAAFQTIRDGLDDGRKDPLKAAENQYARVGTGYFKIIHKVDRFGIMRTELKVWRDIIIIRDQGKEFLDKIPKYDDFNIAPNNLNYQARVDNCYNLFMSFRTCPQWESGGGRGYY